jgi:hypothetical protein
VSTEQLVKTSPDQGLNLIFLKDFSSLFFHPWNSVEFHTTFPFKQNHRTSRSPCASLTVLTIDFRKYCIISRVAFKNFVNSSISKCKYWQLNSFLQFKYFFRNQFVHTFCWARSVRGVSKNRRRPVCGRKKKARKISILFCSWDCRV